MVGRKCFNMTINDLRPIIAPYKTIRIWDNNQSKELINPKVLFSGSLSDLAFTEKIAKETIIEMTPISNVLVFYINHKE